MIPFYDGYQGEQGEGQQPPQQQQQQQQPGAMPPPQPPILTPTRDVAAFNRCVAQHTHTPNMLRMHALT